MGINHLIPKNQIHTKKNWTTIINQVEQFLMHLRELLTLPPITKNNEASDDDLAHQHNKALSSDVVQENVDNKKRLTMYLKKIYFKSKVIEFANVTFLVFALRIRFNKKVSC